MRPKTACLGQSIDGEVVWRAGLLTESQVFEDETLPGTESADHPPQEIPEQHDHGKNLIGTNPNSAFGQVTHFAGVRYFGETQAYNIKRMFNILGGLQLKASFSIV